MFAGFHSKEYFSLKGGCWQVVVTLYQLWNFWIYVHISGKENWENKLFTWLKKSLLGTLSTCTESRYIVRGPWHYRCRTRTRIEANVPHLLSIFVCLAHIIGSQPKLVFCLLNIPTIFANFRFDPNFQRFLVSVQLVRRKSFGWGT